MCLFILKRPDNEYFLQELIYIFSHSLEQKTSQSNLNMLIISIDQRKRKSSFNNIFRGFMSSHKSFMFSIFYDLRKIIHDLHSVTAKHSFIHVL